jgi:hypothetical protein
MKLSSLAEMEVTRMKGAGMKVVRLHESGRNVCTGRPISERMHASGWHACKWLEYMGCIHVAGMHAGILVSKWHECGQKNVYVQVARMHVRGKNACK